MKEALALFSGTYVTHSSASYTSVQQSGLVAKNMQFFCANLTVKYIKISGKVLNSIWYLQRRTYDAVLLQAPSAKHARRSFGIQAFYGLQSFAGCAMEDSLQAGLQEPLPHIRLGRGHHGKWRKCRQKPLACRFCFLHRPFISLQKGPVPPGILVFKHARSCPPLQNSFRVTHGKSWTGCVLCFVNTI